jgi:hypothetical protein
MKIPSTMISFKKINNFTEISDEAKNKWISQLEKAYQLVKRARKNKQRKYRRS